MTLPLAIALALLIALLTLVSYADRLYTERGKFLSREFEENIAVFERQVEPRLGVGRTRAALSMAILVQLTTASIALLIGYTVFYDGVWNFLEIAQAALSITVIVIVFNRLLPFVFFSRTKGEWLAPLSLLLRILIYLVFPVTLVLGFCLSVAALTKDHAEPEPDRPSEAVDALIEAGQEEGILQERDRQLIQSVVEFGDKTVREVMTPRPEIVAVPVGTTVEQFTELLRTKPYSRVPVYENSIDHIRGIVFAHDVLQVADTEARARTVGELMKPEILFVPESKRVNDLLRELQKQNIHMSVVIDEYGGVAGVATIEDLVEEIVGEIRDEHEAESDVIRENEASYVVPGNMDVDRLDELFGVKLEGREATTVAGLVSELLGRIPRPGEVVENDGLRFEILESTERRVERLRVSSRQKTPSRQMPA